MELAFGLLYFRAEVRMRTLGILALLGLLVASSTRAVAQEKATAVTPSKPSRFIHATFLYHIERRDNVREHHQDGFLGFDSLLNPETNVWIGARVGFYNEKVLTSIPVGVNSNSRPAVGFHVYKLLPLENSLAFKLGGGADVLYAGSSFDFPLWLYTGGEAAFRAYLSPEIYAEIPVEIGFFPFFDGIPVYSKIGLQVGFGF